MVRLVKLDKLYELDKVSYDSDVRLVKVGYFGQVTQLGQVSQDR